MARPRVWHTPCFFQGPQQSSNAFALDESHPRFSRAGSHTQHWRRCSQFSWILDVCIYVCTFPLLYVCIKDGCICIVSCMYVYLYLIFSFTFVMYLKMAIIHKQFCQIWAINKIQKTKVLINIPHIFGYMLAVFFFWGQIFATWQNLFSFF
jgi:hypothetical protein